MTNKNLCDSKKEGATIQNEPNTNIELLFKDGIKQTNNEYHKFSQDILHNSHSYQNINSNREEKLREVIIDKDYTIEQLQNKVLNYKYKLKSYQEKQQDSDYNQLS